MTNPSWTERSVYPFPSITSYKIPLALKRSVIAAHRFLNKICLNEGYLSGPKVCRSNLETTCIFILSKTAIFIPEIAMEDLPLGRTAALVPEFTVIDLPLGRTL